MRTPFIVRIFGPGLGDFIIQMGMFRTLLHEGYYVHLLCKTPSQEELAVRSPWLDRVSMVPEGAPLPPLPEGILLNEEEREGDRRYWEGGKVYQARFGKLHVYNFLETMFERKMRFLPHDAPFQARKSNFRRVVLLSPGARLSKKHWPGERWKAVADYLVRKGFYPVFIGDALTRAIYAHQVAPYPFAQTTIRELIDLVSSVGLVVGVDSGVVHLAEAQGTPTIGLYGPRPAWMWAPPNVYAIQASDGKRSGLKKLSVEQVIHAIDEVVSDT